MVIVLLVAVLVLGWVIFQLGSALAEAQELRKLHAQRSIDAIRDQTIREMFEAAREQGGFRSHD